MRIVLIIMHPYSLTYLITYLFGKARIRRCVISLQNKGPSIKYVTLEEEGVREGVTVCDRGEGDQKHVTSRLYKLLSYI